MKSLNIFKLTADAAVQIELVKDQINNAESMEEAKKRASYGIGFIDCFITVCNRMICLENNDITAQLDTLTEEWTADIYQVMVNAADRFDERELLFKYAESRDEHRKAAKD